MRLLQRAVVRARAGNLCLAVTHDLNCDVVSRIKPIYTPADFLPAIRDCLLRSRYKDAVSIYLVQHVYLIYDQNRMKDISAKAGMGFL